MNSKTICLLLIVLFFKGFTGLAQDTDHWETIFFANSEFRYLTSSQGVPGADWRDPAFDDSAWNTGQGGIGYNDGDDNTIVGACISVAIRKSFTIKDKSIITEGVLHIDYDDAFVAYLNGYEIARSPGLTGDFPAYNQASTYNHEAVMYTGGVPEAFYIDPETIDDLLVDGTNVMAVQVHNTSLTSSDLSSLIFFSAGISSSQQHYYYTPEWFDPPLVFTGSNLPLILIDTYGTSIPDEPKIPGTMKIIYHEDGSMNRPDDTPNVYDGYIGIEVRGATSAGYPQTPYSLETRDSLGQNNNIPLLGMPRENDWVLLSHYNEKTFMRNPLSFHLFAEMGHYATRYRLAEVMLNGQYQGIYLFGEKVKRDRWRIDIAEIHPWNNSGDSLTGGYIFKTEYYSSVDTWKSDYAPYHHPSYSTWFAYYYPKYYVISDKQRQYLKSAVDAFQRILHQDDFTDHYMNFIDVPSFIDYFIISEVSRNVDGYKKSRYLYKDQDSRGGLIHSGPVWDFDWAWKNIPECFFGNTDGSGWAYKVNDCRSTPAPGWMARLLEDPVFANKLKCRYTELRETLLSETYLNNFMDSIYHLVHEAQKMHYERWDILGRGTGAPEIEPPAATFEQEVQRLRNWISIRLAWLDDNMPGSAENCEVTGSLMTSDHPRLRIFPNPASELLFVESDLQISEVAITGISGKTVMRERAAGRYSWQLQVDRLDPGIYIVTIITGKGNRISEKLYIQ